MFVPVHIGLGAGGAATAEYDRGIELTVRQLKAFEHEAGNLHEPLSAVAEDLHVQVEAAFASQGATGASGRWTKLSEPYGSWKQQRVAGVPVLVGLRRAGAPVRAHSGQSRSAKRRAKRASASRGGTRRRQTYEPSGQMMRQLLVPIADQSTWFIDSRRLLYHPQSDIAGFHETGTERMPARPPVALTLEFLHSVDRQFVRWLAAVMKKTGV